MKKGIRRYYNFYFIGLILVFLQLLPATAIADKPAGLAVDYGADGLWYFDGSATFEELINVDADTIVAYGGRLAYIGSNGDLYSYFEYDSPPWTLLVTIPTEGHIEYHNGSFEGLALDAGTTLGVWLYDGGNNSWTQLVDQDVQDMVAFGDDMLAVTCAASNSDCDEGELWTYDENNEITISITNEDAGTVSDVRDSTTNSTDFAFHIFQQGDAVEKEHTGVFCQKASALSSGDYFTIFAYSSGEVEYDVWYDIDNGGGYVGDRGTNYRIEVDISSNDAASAVASASVTALDANSNFTATTEPWVKIYDPDDYGNHAVEEYVAYFNGTADGLAVDLGTGGLLFYDGSLPLLNDSNTLTASDVGSLVAFDETSNTLATTYQGHIWIYNPDDSPSWSKISGDLTTNIVECYIAYDKGSGQGLAMDAGTEGFHYYDGTLPLEELTYADIADPVAMDNLLAVTYLGDLYKFDPNDGTPWTLIDTDSNEGYIAYGDRDGDGLLDSFEQLIADDSTTITNIEDVIPADDYDGDGLTNQEEYDLGSDPTKDDIFVDDTTCTHCDFSTIQAAINAASDNDIVYVYDGTYNEDIDFDTFYNNHRTIKLQSFSGNPSNCIIDADANDSVIKVDDEGISVEISGFTITDGQASDGGGIYCEKSSLTVDNCRITENDAGTNGGGIYGKNAMVTIIDSDITSNMADDGNTNGGNGGGIACDQSCNITISGTNFSNNTLGTSNGTVGKAIWGYDSTGKVSNTQISETGCPIWTHGMCGDLSEFTGASSIDLCW